MNKRQRKKKQKSIQVQVIERLETLKRSFNEVLGNHKYIKANQFEIIMDRIIDEVKHMK